MATMSCLKVRYASDLGKYRISIRTQELIACNDLCDLTGTAGLTSGLVYCSIVAPKSQARPHALLV